MEMYQITVVCSVKHLTCYIKGESNRRSILCDAQLLTMYMLSAKCPTRNSDSSVRFGRASFAGRSENQSTHLCYHEVVSVVITNCCRNGEQFRHGLCILYLDVD